MGTDPATGMSVMRDPPIFYIDGYWRTDGSTSGFAYNGRATIAATKSVIFSDSLLYLGSLLARDKRVKVTAVGPLERQTAPQWVKSWHTVQVVAPYREIRELAARIEADRGVLEDLRLEPAPLPPSGRADPTAPVDEVQARFRMAALELSAPAKRLVDRALGGGGGSVGILAAPGQVPEAPLARDPFAFVVAPAAPRVDTRVTPLDFTGTVNAPGGSLGIVNDTIVKVGDVIEGYRIERIADGSVVMRRAGEGPRTLRLPDSVPVTNLRR